MELDDPEEENESIKSKIEAKLLLGISDAVVILLCGSAFPSRNDPSPAPTWNPLRECFVNTLKRFLDLRFRSTKN